MLRFTTHTSSRALLGGSRLRCARCPDFCFRTRTKGERFLVRNNARQIGTPQLRALLQGSAREVHANIHASSSTMRSMKYTGVSPQAASPIKPTHYMTYSGQTFGKVVLVQTLAPRLTAPIFLAPILAFLKSGTVIKSITLVSRVALSLVAPLRLGARRILVWWHGHEHVAELHAQAIATGGNAGSHHWHGAHFKRTTVILLVTPVVLVAIAVLASLERTPIWGRWRVIMMSADEEALMVEEFLAPGTPGQANSSAAIKRDWVAILRAANEEERNPPGTLSGARVLDNEKDWRARWVQDVLLRLESGIAHANLTADCKERKVFRLYDGHEFALPPPDYPLGVRPALLKHHGHSEEGHAEGPLVTHFGCLVVESPECNAFSLGFGPALDANGDKHQEAPGVVVVYTGLLEEILATTEAENSHRVEMQPASAFGIFQRSREMPASVGVSKSQTDQLAVVLSHEVGHLLLSHSLESLATNNMDELLGTLATDLARIILYPLTAFLGPVFNDWFGEQIKVNSSLGLNLKSCCEQRKAEHEADRLGLRILVGAGFDPRVALKVWGEDGVMQRAARTEEALITAAKAQGKVAKEDDSDGWLVRNGFTRTHPMNEERLEKVVDELKRWESL